MMIPNAGVPIYGVQNQLINQDNSNQLRLTINETKKEIFDLQQDYNNYLVAIIQ